MKHFWLFWSILGVVVWTWQAFLVVLECFGGRGLEWLKHRGYLVRGVFSSALGGVFRDVLERWAVFVEAFLVVVAFLACVRVLAPWRASCSIRIII